MNANADAPSGSADGVTVEALVAAGRALERDGRPAEAVSQYDRGQRLRPDPGLSERILRLRCEAAAHPVGHGPALWPPVVADSFSEAPAPPEVRTADLTADLLGSSILNRGCLIVRGLLDQADATEVREQAQASLAARDRIVADQAREGDPQWYRPFEPTDRSLRKTRRFIEEAGGLLMVDSPPVMCGVLDLLGRTGLPELISEYLQEAAVVSARKCVLRCVRGAVPTWHQDGSFMGADVHSVDVWVALTDCGPGTGAAGLDVLPVRVDELLDTQTHGAVHAYSIGEALVDEIGAGRSWVTPRFEVGDAIVFDERFVHRSAVGEGYGAERYAIEAWYFGASTVPDRYVPIMS